MYSGHGNTRLPHIHITYYHYCIFAPFHWFYFQFGYMTEIDKVEILEKHEIEAQGEDIQSLLFHLLDEFLFLFSAEPFFIARVKSTFHMIKLLIYSIKNFLCRKWKSQNLIASTSKLWQLAMEKLLIWRSTLREQKLRLSLTLTCKFMMNQICIKSMLSLIFKWENVKYIWISCLILIYWLVSL